MNMFRTLTPDEVIDFERYAYDNDPPERQPMVHHAPGLSKIMV